MVTRAQMVELEAANDQIDRLLNNDLRQVWANVDLGDRARVRDVLLDVAPQLVDQYGQINATLMADFFDDAISAAPVLAAANPEKVQQSVRWAVGPLWEDDAPAALGNLSGALQRHTRQVGRDTLDLSVRNTRGVTYARVPGGGDTCPFCVMTASRGPVYGSERDAGGQGNSYHDDCKCIPIAVKSKADLPPQYEPDRLFEQYQEYRNQGLI